MAAGAAVDRLANEYRREHKPVLFIEQNVDAPLGPRIDRWFDYYGGQAPPDAGVPLVIVDSGYRASYGWADFENEYREMVDDALAHHPPGAEIYAGYERNGNDVAVTAVVTNLSGQTLSLRNSATLNALVWERAHVVETNRIVRAATAGAISGDLPHEQTATYRLELRDVPVQEWRLSRVLVMLDYRPDPESTRFEMLQAVEAVAGAPPTRTPVPTNTPTTIAPTRQPTFTPTPGPSPTPIPGVPIYLPLISRDR